MPKGQFLKRLPTAQSIKESRFLKPFGPYLDHHFLWQFNRRSVAGGVAVGLFFGLLIPFAQIFFAALIAILLRVNLPTAAFCTLVSNPLTFPAIYYAAYKLGDFLTGAEVEVAEVVIESDIEEVMTVQQGEVVGWFPSLLLWLESVGLPLALGLFVMASAAALLGYFLVSGIWRLQVGQRWRKRRHLRL